MAGGGPVDEADAARTSGGEVLRTSTGAAVSQEAHNHWTEGLRLFGRYEEQGWNSGRCAEVEAKFDQAADAQNGAFAEAHYMMGLARQRCDDTDGARRHYQRSVEVSANYCPARVALVLMEQQASNNPREARAKYEQIIASDGQCTEAYVNLARIQAAAGGAQVDEAIQNLRRALAVESQYLPAFNELALIYYRRGEDSRNRSSLDLAEIVCRQAELINNRYAPIYNTWGLVKMRRGDLIEALRFFERAIQLDSSLFEAQMNFGQITNSFRGYEDAKRAFARAAELQPRSYDAAVGLGAALRGLGQIDQAEAQYNRARELDGSRPEAYYNLALLYHDYKSGSIADLNRAKEYFQQFLQRAGENTRYTEPRELVTRRCRDQQAQPRGSRRRRVIQQRQCRPGRIQLIDETIAAVREGEAMQREVEEMQRQQQQQQGSAN
ncbi:MAG: tetratricopeptide repeat protein [Polyangiaceae bacterium]|nr:tetratricopeptide repeat protein [Polyangiaceae bacterium]